MPNDDDDDDDRNKKLGEIAGFRYGLHGLFRFLGYYAA